MISVGVPVASTYIDTPATQARVPCPCPHIDYCNLCLVVVLQSDEDLQGWLARSDFSGLLRLPDTSSVPVDRREVRHVQYLVAGKRYFAIPSRGGIKTLRAGASSLKVCYGRGLLQI